MDDNRFDSLTRQVAQQSTRRTMVTAAMGGALALLGLGGLGQSSAARNKRGKNHSNRTGFEDDECATNTDCLKGLRCEGARTGIAPGFPTPIAVPVITGKPGRCRYQKSCGGEQGDACKRNGDCCNNDNGNNLTCDNNRCKRD